MELPLDLVPLPTAPYDERPDSLPLDVEECRTALWLEKGNITEAAKRLKITPRRLRQFVAKSARLTEEQKEAQNQLVDIAESNVYEALTDGEDSARRDTMSRFVLTQLGGDRGYGNGKGGVTINPKGKSGAIMVTWGDGSPLSPDEGPSSDGDRMIEGEVVNG